jgi:hypothetical protein
LAAAPAVAALAACTSRPNRRQVDIRDHGATGDGTTDDAPAIGAAVAALKSGDRLYFPKGNYRFAEQHPRGGAAILLDGLSDVDVEFESGAELVMDNLDRGLGTSHGILIRGPGARIGLHNITMRWATRPVRRSMGDGIRIVGYPGEPTSALPAGWTASGGPVTDVTVRNYNVRLSPQAGMIMIGVSGIDVSGMRAQDTQADGLHFNACRRARIEDHTAINTGDDGLALVTYFTPEFGFDNTAQTFSFPDLTDWSNADFTAANITVAGGRANGVRLAGAQRVTLSGLAISNVQTGAAVIADSSALGADTGWHYVAGRALRLDGLTVDDCETGIHLLARPDANVDPRFTDFDLHVVDTAIRGSANWSVRAESLTSQRATGLTVDTATVETASTQGGCGGVGVRHAHGVRLGEVDLRLAQPVTGFSALDAADLTVTRLGVQIADWPAEPQPVPCVSFEDSDGSVEELTVSWRQAPSSWIPVRVTGGGAACGSGPAAPAVSVGTVRVEPPTVADPIGTC